MKPITIISLGFACGSRISNVPSDIIIKEMFSDYNALLAFGLTTKQNYKVVEPILNITRDCRLSESQTWPNAILNQHTNLSTECVGLLSRYSYLFSSIKLSEELGFMVRFMRQMNPSPCTFILDICPYWSLMDPILFTSLLDSSNGFTIEFIMRSFSVDIAKILGGRLNSTSLNIIGLQFNQPNRHPSIDKFIFQGLPGSKIKHLKFLSLIQMEEDSVLLLASVLNRTVIETLILDFQFVNERCNEALYRAISETPSLKKLVVGLGSARILRISLEFMALYLPQSNVNDLSLVGIDCYHTSYPHFLTMIERTQKLRKLKLTAQLVGIYTTTFAATLGRSQITQLIFDNTFMDNDFVKSLASGLSSTKINTFICNRCHLKSGMFKALAGGLPGTNIKHLEITNNGFEGIDELIAILPRMEFLKYLSLSNTLNNADTVNQLALLLPSTHISYLDLSSNQFGDEGAYSLANAVARSEVVDLNVERCGIRISAGRVLKNSKPSMRLQLGWALGSASDPFGIGADENMLRNLQMTTPRRTMVSMEDPHANSGGCFNCIIS